jgi:hypothetical protein
MHVDRNCEAAKRNGLAFAKPCGGAEARGPVLLRDADGNAPKDGELEGAVPRVNPAASFDASVCHLFRHLDDANQLKRNPLVKRVFEPRSNVGEVYQGGALTAIHALIDAGAKAYSDAATINERPSRDCNRDCDGPQRLAAASQRHERSKTKKRKPLYKVGLARFSENAIREPLHAVAALTLIAVKISAWLTATLTVYQCQAHWRDAKRNEVSQQNCVDDHAERAAK